MCTCVHSCPWSLFQVELPPTYQALVFMVCDALLYGLLAWYLDAVIRGMGIPARLISIPCASPPPSSSLQETMGFLASCESGFLLPSLNSLSLPFLLLSLSLPDTSHSRHHTGLTGCHGAVLRRSAPASQGGTVLISRATRRVRMMRRLLCWGG